MKIGQFLSINKEVGMKKNVNELIHQFNVGNMLFKRLNKNISAIIPTTKEKNTSELLGQSFLTLISFLLISRNFPSSVKVMILNFWTIIGIATTKNTKIETNVVMFPTIPATDVKTDKPKAKYMFRRLILTFCLLLDFCSIYLPYNCFGFYNYSLTRGGSLSKVFTKIISVCGMFLCIYSCKVYADTNQIAELIERAESKHEIPKGLLASIAQIESNNHPFAINSGGKAYFANDIESAKSYIASKLAVGITNIDIGIMQINWRYHEKEFSGISHMLSPAANIDYAGKLLALLKNQHGDWHTAVRYYHSSNPKYYRVYSRKVVMNWINGG
ncbi:MAG: transglycosylase SLT domain-containing protein [Rickettsiaceae bacterium]|nr:transglycosylase SLT domain-containing protein [Rickettsiaceae bacterium]